MSCIKQKLNPQENREPLVTVPAAIIASRLEVPPPLRDSPILRAASPKGPHSPQLVVPARNSWISRYARRAPRGGGLRARQCPLRGDSPGASARKGARWAMPR